MYRLIRIADNYAMVIAVTPEDAKPEDQGSRFFLYNEYIAQQKKVDPDFVEVTKSVAIQYFGGIADGLGWGNLPSKAFKTLDEIKVWRQKSVKAWTEKRLAEQEARKKERLVELKEKNARFKIIRVAEDYSMILAIIPEDAKPDTEGSLLFMYNKWNESAESNDCDFEDITESGEGWLLSRWFLSSHTDDLGWADLPSETFETLNEIKAWREKRIEEGEIKDTKVWRDKVLTAMTDDKILTTDDI